MFDFTKDFNFQEVMASPCMLLPRICYFCILHTLRIFYSRRSSDMFYGVFQSILSLLVVSVNKNTWNHDR